MSEKEELPSKVLVDKKALESLLLAAHLTQDDTRAKGIAEDVFGGRGFAAMSTESRLEEALIYYHQITNEKWIEENGDPVDEVFQTMIELGITPGTKTKEGKTFTNILFENPDHSRLSSSGGDLFLEMLDDEDGGSPVSVHQDFDNDRGIGPVALLFEQRGWMQIWLPDEGFIKTIYERMIAIDGEDLRDRHGCTTFERIAAASNRATVEAVMEADGFKPEARSAAKICEIFGQIAISEHKDIEGAKDFKNIIKEIIDRDQGVALHGEGKNGPDKAAASTPAGFMGEALVSSLPRMIKAAEKAALGPEQNGPRHRGIQDDAYQAIETYLWLVLNHPYIAHGGNNPTSEELENSLRPTINELLSAEQSKDIAVSLLEAKLSLNSSRDYGKYASHGPQGLSF